MKRKILKIPMGRGNWGDQLVSLAQDADAEPWESFLPGPTHPVATETTHRTSSGDAEWADCIPAWEKQGQRDSKEIKPRHQRYGTGRNTHSDGRQVTWTGRVGEWALEISKERVFTWGSRGWGKRNTRRYRTVRNIQYVWNWSGETGRDHEGPGCHAQNQTLSCKLRFPKC